MDHVEAVVVGAGAIGLATARALAGAGREVMVIERNETFGMETSARSNEVVHASIFHRPGSPQGILCRRGRDLIYEYCAARGVATRRTGKLVLALTAEDRPWLADMLARGLANGVDDLTWLEPDEVAGLEPAIRCEAALLSPSSGILHTHNLMLAYLADLEAEGGLIAFNSEVVRALKTSEGFRLVVRDRASRVESDIACRLLVNAAGIWATGLARSIDGMPPGLVPAIHLAKGVFFKLVGRNPFSHLIVPAQPAWRNGGIMTLDLGGQAKFGPDEEWVAEVDYAMNEKRAAGVAAAVRTYYPDLPEDVLTPDYSGIRPRLNGPGELSADWLFQGPAEHGVTGLINLYGLESPGITSSLAIAETVVAMVDGSGSPFVTSIRRSGAPAAGVRL